MPSLNQIKVGLQKWAILELVQSCKGANNQYMAKAKFLRKHFWEAVFAKIKTEDDYNEGLSEVVLSD